MWTKSRWPPRARSRSDVAVGAGGGLPPLGFRGAGGLEFFLGLLSLGTLGETFPIPPMPDQWDFGTYQWDLMGSAFHVPSPRTTPRSPVPKPAPGPPPSAPAPVDYKDYLYEYYYVKTEQAMPAYDYGYYGNMNETLSDTGNTAPPFTTPSPPPDQSPPSPSTPSPTSEERTKSQDENWWNWCKGTWRGWWDPTAMVAFHDISWSLWCGSHLTSPGVLMVLVCSLSESSAGIRSSCSSGVG